MSNPSVTSTLASYTTTSIQAVVVDRRTEWRIPLLSFALILFGLVMIYTSSAFSAVAASTSKTVGAEGAANQFHYLRSQSVALVVALAAMMFTSLAPYRWWYKFANIILGVSIALAAATLILAPETMGAKRWLSFSFRNVNVSVQPSEFCKIALVVYCSAVFSRIREPGTRLWRQYLLPLLPVGALILLIGFEPDFGTGLLLTLMVIAMLFAAGFTWYFLAIPLGGMGIVGVAAYFTVPYITERLKAWIASLKYIFADGDFMAMHYHVRESIVALGSGGLWGKGIGKGVLKTSYLPQIEADYIASAVGEELGFVTIASIILAFSLILYFGYRIATHMTDTFGAYLAFGLTTLIGVQVFINIGVITGLLPPKGIVLPFVSHGGTALIAMAALVGMLTQLSRHTVDVHIPKQRNRRR